MPYSCPLKRKKYHQEYYLKNKEDFSLFYKEYYLKNSEKIKEKSRKYRVKNKEKLKLYSRDKDKKREYDRKYKKENRARVNKYLENKKKIDVQFKLQTILRNRLLRALKTKYKTGSAVRDLGCTIPEFKKYLESLFSPGMTWNNHGVRGWHIDHISPLSKFDLTDRTQFLEAVNYKNLAPLWWDENIRKSNKQNI